jgi:transposase
MHAQFISFEFVRQQLRASYSETGRPSIDPELLLRILLIGYLEIVARCLQAGLVRGDELSVDGSFVEAVRHHQ